MHSTIYCVVLDKYIIVFIATKLLPSDFKDSLIQIIYGLYLNLWDEYTLVLSIFP